MQGRFLFYENAVVNCDKCSHIKILGSFIEFYDGTNLVTRMAFKTEAEAKLFFSAWIKTLAVNITPQSVEVSSSEVKTSKKPEKKEDKHE